MLAIRMQRTGRKGHAQFRIVVQDSRLTPTSGKVVAWLGSYDPHAKTAKLDKDKASFYLSNGAQPSERVARLLQTEGLKLPDWARPSSGKKRETRNPEKRRSTRPDEPAEAPTEPDNMAAADEAAPETAEVSIDQADATEPVAEKTDEAEATAEKPQAENVNTTESADDSKETDQPDEAESKADAKPGKAEQSDDEPKADNA